MYQRVQTEALITAKISLERDESDSERTRSTERHLHSIQEHYTFGPTFRAENSNTTRHAAEFWMIEPEIAFADLEDNMDLAESMLKYVISYVLENAPEEMNFFNSFVDKGLLDRLNNVVNSDLQE